MDVLCLLKPCVSLQMMEMCTDKLRMSGAARRVFLDDGTEVFSAQEIPRDSDVFLSMGEPFRDPFQGAKSKFNTTAEEMGFWTALLKAKRSK